MSLAQTVAWDVQTGGNSANGGGFDTASAGTDYSQVTTPQVAFNGTSISATTSGISTTILITGYTVASGDVGNIVNITGGTNFTTGRYEISSVNTGANTWTLDRNATTGIGAAMTGNMGGCLDTPNTAMQATAATGAVADMTTYVKVGTYNLTVAITTPNSAQSKYQTRVLGYNASHGDNPVGSNRPVIATNGNAINALNVTTNSGWRFENLIFDGSGSTKGLIGIYDNGGLSAGYINIKILNFGSQGFLTNSAAVQINSSEITGCGATTGNGAIESNGSPATIFVNQCWIHDNSKSGIYFFNSGSAPLILTKSIISNNTGASSDGVTCDYDCVMIGNIFFGNGRDGVHFISPYDQISSVNINNIYASNSGFGMNWISAPIYKTISTFNYNGFYNNTSGNYNNFIAAPNDVACSVNPFTASASNNFTLNNTASGGASLRAAGTPSIVGGLTQLGYTDIGTYQHQDSGSGGGPVGNNFRGGFCNG